MKWFYNLKNKMRVIISVCSWIPFLVALSIAGSLTPEGETMPNWATIVLIPCVALGIVFTVLAVKAYRKEHPKEEKPITQKEKKEKVKKEKVSKLKVERDYYTKVRGVTFGNDDGSSRQEAITHCKAGDEVVFLPCEDGNYAGAIGVFTKDGEQLGYLSSERGEEIRENYIDNPMKVTISEITGGPDGKTFGCNLHIIIYKK